MDAQGWDRIREDVEALLRADIEADGTSDSSYRFEPAMDVELRSRLETALGERYRIIHPLGHGAMGFVYLVQDRKHDRQLALKLLLPDVAGALDSTRNVQRFVREMQIAGRLSHPHIVPLYDSGEADGLLYYTMPFVPGESLRDRLRRERQLPIDDALVIARDVLSALDFAHRQGVVHRDIKPENILLEDGGALVADFGIAIALSPPSDDRLTGTGVSVGTPNYMSPEQAVGDPEVDGRADLYAVSAVLYEMLCGEPPHSAANTQAVIAKVLSDEPSSVQSRRPNVPDHVATAIARGLNKLPADRWQTAHELADALALRKPDRPRFRISPRLLLQLAVIVAAAAAIVLAVRQWPRSAQSAEVMSFDLALPDSAAPQLALGTSVALSPDGSIVAYIGGATRSVYVRLLNELFTRRLVGTEGAHCPSFSPDGQWIVFVSNFRLWKSAVGGGLPSLVTDTADMCAVWTDRNEILFNRNRQLFRITPNGGTATLVASPDSTRRIGDMIPSQALPGGLGALIFLGERVGYWDWQIGLVTLPEGNITRLTSGGAARYRPLYADGHLVFAQSNAVIAAPFSLRTLRFTGPEVALVHGATSELGVSTNGRLVYMSGHGTMSLVAVNEHGRERVLAGTRASSRADSPAMTPLDTALYSWPRLSPDGKRIALEVKTGLRSWDIWIYDIPSQTLTRLTNNFTGVWPAGWTHDGRSVVFFGLDSAGLVFGNRPRRIMVQPWDGSAPPRELMRLPTSAFDLSIGPPHTYVAFAPSFSIDDIWIAPLDTPQAARALIATPAIETEPRLSPDGKLLAYLSLETGEPEVYVRELSPLGRRLQVSTRGGRDPVWSADGRQLFYRGDYVIRATMARHPELAVTRRDTLFRDVYSVHNVANFDVFPSGKELLMIRENPGRFHVTLVINWPELMHRGAPHP